MNESSSQHLPTMTDTRRLRRRAGNELNMDRMGTRSDQFSIASGCILWLLIGLMGASTLRAQVSADEHAKHHPGAAAAADQSGEMSRSAPGAKAGGMGGAGGMMEGMGEMMKGMGGMPPKALYPSLMDLPDLAPEKRDEVLRTAHERMKSGADLMGDGLDQLVRAAPTNDYAAMQAATALLREGVARFDSGLAANRAIAEGKDPRALALQWFKGQMNLRTTALGVEPSGPLGLTWSHLFIMVLLVAFAAVMIAMYFFKMRRAAALFGRIEAGKGGPPPGSAPPLAGTPGPSAPGSLPEGKSLPAGEKKPPAEGKAPPAERKTPPAQGKHPAPEEKSLSPEGKTPPAAEVKAAAPPSPLAADAKLAAPATAATEEAKPPAPAAPPGAEPKAATPSAPPTADGEPAPPAPAPAAEVKVAAPDALPAADAKAPPTAAPNEAALQRNGFGVAADAKAAPQYRPVSAKFTCHAPTAQEVFLAGTFNGWNAKATPMKKDVAGNWDVAIALVPGRYEFKFVIDGAMCCEPGCDEAHKGCSKCVTNAAGTMNRVIEVA